MSAVPGQCLKAYPSSPLSPTTPSRIVLLIPDSPAWQVEPDAGVIF